MINGFDEAELWDIIYWCVRNSGRSNDEIEACLDLLNEYV